MGIETENQTRDEIQKLHIDLMNRVQVLRRNEKEYNTTFYISFQ